MKTPAPNTASIIQCEKYVLQQFGITISELKPAEHDPSFRIGDLCAEHGLSISRRYYATLLDVKNALDQGAGVIVSVDSGELEKGKTARIAELVEDRFVGEFPDGALVILSLDDEIVAYNPEHGETPQRISRERLLDAWQDSKFYLVSVNTLDKVVASYIPTPLNLDDVTLPEELDELTEAVAENTHEVWSKGRMAEGWTYGPERNDPQKKHPDLLPYSALTEGEKEYDRATALNALKLIMKLGYRIKKQ